MALTGKDNIEKIEERETADYVVISNECHDKVNYRVNELISKGYQPKGELRIIPSMTIYKSQRNCYTQVMVKYKQNTKE